MLKNIKKYFEGQLNRDKFVIDQINNIKDGSLILDAGCGNQRYRDFCSRLIYKCQDFGGYSKDVAPSFTDGAGGKIGYKYGEIDYLGNIWNIDEKEKTFDAILCTEVFEHIPYPNETIKEFSRLLKSGGKVIITAPSNCLRHMDPYFFYSGFSDHWYKEILGNNGFKIISIEPVGDYYKWLAIELGRAGWHHGILAKLLLFPAFLYFRLKKPNQRSINTLCLGYYVVAEKN